MTRRRLRERFWWLDVIYPIALAALLFGSLTYIVYEGQRQWRLALQAEDRMKEFSLRHNAGRPVRARGAVLTVTAGAADVSREGRAPLGNFPEASAAAYAQVIERLSDAGVPLIFVHWDTEAHPNDEVYDLPLIEAVQRIRDRTKVYLVGPPAAFPALPEELRRQVSLADDDPCQEAAVVQTECTYNRDFDDWAIQAILNELGEKNQGKKPPPPWISTELSSLYSRYLLNLSDPQEIPTLSFRDVLSHRADDRLAGYQVAFVGADQSQGVSGAGATYLTRMVRTVYDDSAGDVSVVGTPLHVYWAMIAQMYLDKAMIAIPPGWVIVATTLAFCGLIVLVMALFGGPATLGMIIVYIVSGPWINALAIRWLQVYLPLFDSYYFGLSTFIVAGLGRLSTAAFHRWQLDARQRLHASMADLKGNFISLLSHNLNTPVAKMQGMLSLLANQPQKPWFAPARRAEAVVTQLEYAIRSVLVASVLEEGVVSETVRTPPSLVQEFLTSYQSSLKRLGIQLVTGAVQAEEEESLLIPVAFDVRAVTAAIGALAALFHVPGQVVTLTMGFKVVGAGADATLIVTLGTLDSWIDRAAAAVLTSPSLQKVRTLGGRSFFAEVLAGLVHLAVHTYGGTVVLSPAAVGDRLGGEVIATFHARGAGGTGGTGGSGGAAGAAT